MTVRARALGSRYQLEDELGSGAMGTVWRARDLETDEAVAAKVLHEHFASDTGIVTRFLQERTFLLQLDHPNIVKVRDLVVEGSALGIVMDLVEGSDVRALLTSKGTLEPGTAARITADSLDGLAHGHALSVLHRDVKPDNVLLDAGAEPRARLSDFSIARLAQETTVRMTGVLGTADYMAPEVFAEEVSSASDVYGAGIMLYELLAGRTPFSGGAGSNAYAIARRHEIALPPVLPGLNERLWVLLSSMLAKTPSERPTAAVASAELRRLIPVLAGVAALPVQAPPPTWTDVPGASSAGNISVRSAAPGTLDGEGTLIGRRSAPAAAHLPVAGAAGSAPSAPHVEEADARLTSLGERFVPRPVLDVPELELTSEAAGRPLWFTLAVGGAVLAVVAVAGVVGSQALSGGGKPTRSSTTTQAAGTGAITAQLADPSDGSGLSINRSAEYDAKAKTVTVKVEWSSSTALTGPFLEAVPAATKGGQCPAVQWAAPISARRSVVSSLDATACGFEAPVGKVGPQDRVSGSYTIALELTGNDKVAALSAYLAQAQAAERTALGGLGNSTSYAAQRLRALDVAVLVPPVQGAAVSLSVFPIWLTNKGSSNDNVNPLFLNPGGAQSLMDQLGGPGALQFGSNHCTDQIKLTTLQTRTTAQDCTITVRLPGGAEGESASFTILPHGS